MDDAITKLPDRPFTLTEALDAGFSKRQLRSKRFANPLHGLHAVTGRVDNLCANCAAAMLVLPAAAVFSHTTAASLWLLPLPAPAALEVSVPLGVTVPYRRGLRAHQRKMLDTSTTTCSGLPVTTPVATYLDMAERLDRAQLTALGDVILRRRLATRADLEKAADLAARKRGVRLARAVAPTLDPGAESPRESYLRALIVSAGLPTPEVNVNVYDRDGTFLARADLLFRKQRVIVEYDGDHHRTDKRQFAADLARAAVLQKHGYIVLRFTAAHMRDAEWVIRTIRDTLAAR